MEKEEKKNYRRIIEFVINELKEGTIEFSYEKFLNGYYIFDFGEDSVFHFRIKGIKGWLFGIWCSEKQNEENIYRISIFGEQDDHIDKFKPTATNISYTFDFDDKEEGHPLYTEILDFIELVKKIRMQPLICEWFLYNFCGLESFMHFTISNFIYRKFKKPLKKVYNEKLIHWYLKLIRLVYLIRFKHYGKDFDVIVEKREKGWSPRYDFRVVYGDMDEDKAFELYHKINKEDYGKYFLIPEFMFGDVRLTNARNKDDHSGFYYDDGQVEDDDKIDIIDLGEE